MTASIVYQEELVLAAKYYHPKSDDYLHYLCTISIKKSGKNPIQMVLEFDGIPPFAAPMPPERHEIKAPSILELYVKVARWFKKYGYEIK
ncbi:MAG: hypothetical protein U5R49_26080 [Deltaproteobacteria bacterium]|nr:hypothetical protein [Deltaproteobacteria bacterium]